MLVLSRKVGESIRIGDNIELQIVAVRGGRVRVGITAPDDVRILRSELPPCFEFELPASRPDDSRPLTWSSGAGCQAV